MTDVDTRHAWTLTIPAPGDWKPNGKGGFLAAPEWLTMNSRLSHWPEYRLKKKWRAAARNAAEAAEVSGGGRVRLPVGAVTRARVDVTLHFATRRGVRRDTTNWHPTAKVVLDALTKGTVNHPGWGFMPDDEPTKHLHCEECPHITIHPERLDTKAPFGPVGLLVMTLTDLSDSR